MSVTAVVALATPVTLLAVGNATPAGAAAKSSVTCTALTGTTTGTVTVSKCTPASSTNKTVTGTSAKLATGGSLVWAPSKQTTIVSKPKLKVGGTGCAKGSTEEVATGSVTGGTSKYTKKGDVFSASVCLTGKKVTIVKGSKVLL
ncbi:MAG: hypothetical protein ABSC41_11565 [Acidimicrobiales bacterium]